MSKSPLRLPAPASTPAPLPSTAEVLLSALTIGAVEMLAQSVNASRPTTDEDYYSAAEARGALIAIAKSAPEGTPFDTPAPNVTLTGACFRFVDRVFREARASGQRFTGGAAPWVLQAMEAVERAKRGERGEKAPAPE